MKFYNGQVCKKPFRKGLIVAGSILLGVSLLLLLLALLIYFTADDKEAIGAFVVFSVFSGILFIPGLILFIIGIVKRANDSKELKRMQSADYETWKNKRLEDPLDPLFSVKCSRCGGLIEYDLKGLDGKRYWYPNGFVICPNCRAIMRHDAAKNCANKQPSGTPLFCSNCGGALEPGAHFCSHCGKGTN